MALVEVKVPDIGDFKDVAVIELLVKPGDTVKVEQSLVTVESDKASMEIPSSAAGVVKELKVKIGDTVNEGSLVLLLEAAGSESNQAPAPAQQAPAAAQTVASAPPPAAAAAPVATGPVEVRVPDIGDFKDVPVIEIYVKVGDTVKAEDPLVSLESDKATMDVPAPLGGVVQEIRVKIGDKVSEGSVILALSTGSAPASAPAAAAPSVAATAPAAAATAASPGGGIDEAALALAYAGPAVRKLAREMGVDLGRVKGSGNHGRILREDVQAFAQSGGAAAAPAPKAASAPAGGGVGGIDLLPWPKVDFAKFGPIERKEQSRIKKISAANLHRNWVVIPHVTTHDEADITELEQFRVQMNKELEKSGVKVSMLPFMMKAAVATL